MHTITSNLHILHLILSSDIVSIKDLSLILETIHQCVIKHIIFLTIKTIVNFEGFDLLNH
jgi:hypothetical protein